MVFFGEDFITVKKEKNLNWSDLKHTVLFQKSMTIIPKGTMKLLKKMKIK